MMGIAADGRRRTCTAAGSILVAALAGCAPSTPSVEAALDVVEIDGNGVLLSQTQLVTCIAPTGEGQHVFTWTGSNAPTPRHPTEEQNRDRLTLHFSPDPLAVYSFEPRFWSRGGPFTLHWPDPQGQSESMALDTSGVRRFTLLGTVFGEPTPSGSQPLQRRVRIQLTC